MDNPPPLPRSGARSFLYQRTPTHRHQGIDLPAPEGTPVYSPSAGVVQQASEALTPGFSGYGGHVVVRVGEQYGGWLLFAHLSGVDVAPGQTIARGQEIGRVGRTCYTREDPTKLCGGSHLHFEVALRAYPMDSEAERFNPIDYLTNVSAHPLVRGFVDVADDPTLPRVPRPTQEGTAQPGAPFASTISHAGGEPWPQPCFPPSHCPSCTCSPEVGAGEPEGENVYQLTRFRRGDWGGQGAS